MSIILHETKVTEGRARCISYSAGMVRARLAGRKTQTRRVVSPQPTAVHGQGGNYAASYQPDGDGRKSLICPYGRPGDVLVVKEAAWMWCAKVVSGTERTKRTGKPKVAWVECRDVGPIYCADHEGRPTHVPAGKSVRVGDVGYGWHKKNARFLPRWASRGRDVVVSVRVERLQDISRGDAMAEGCPFPNMAKGPDPRQWYKELWESINGPGSWERNDWVWVVEFKVGSFDKGGI